MLLAVAGCSSATTVELLVSANTTDVQSLVVTAQLTTPTRTRQQTLAAPRFPVAVMLVLPDVATDVAVTVAATDGSGNVTSVGGSTRSVPHQRVALALSLTLAGGGDLATAAPSDLARRDLALVADLSPPPPADLANATIADDTFVRPNQPLWGVASDGQTWTLDVNNSANSSVFSISGNAGLAANGANNKYTGLLGPSVSGDVEVLATLTVNDFSTGTNAGTVLRAVDGSTFYKAHLDGNQHIWIELHNAGIVTTLGSQVSVTLQSATKYSLRFQASGSTLRARVWPTASSEPSTWDDTVTDATLTSGAAGVRMQPAGTGTVKYHSFHATRALSP